MELTKEQLLQIDNYVYVCGIKYYDVRMEIVDHFANILEQKLDKNPNLNFKKEIENIHKSFSDRGFSKLLEDKTKAVTKKFYRQSLQHLITFFKVPKIIISVILFAFIYFGLDYFEERVTFFNIIKGITLLLAFRLLFNVNLRDTKKETFLSLNMTLSFFNVFYMLYFILEIIDDTTFINLLGSWDNIFYSIYCLFIILFYWSGEYVYYQNKKLIKQQYPNILV